MVEGLELAAQKILEELGGIKGIPCAWVRPPSPDFGDLSTAVALQVAKDVRRKPMEVAKEIAEKLKGHGDVERVEVKEPGYINIFLTPEALLREVKSTRASCVAKVPRSSDPPVVVDYSSPNIAKPLGIHHILSTVIGQVIANLYRHLGFNVVTVNHIGDWGTQFGQLFIAFKRWGEKPLERSSVDDLLHLYVRFHDEVESNRELEERAREAFRKLEEGEPEIREFWKKVVEISMKEIERIYERLHVHLEYVHGESFYEGTMQPIVEEGKKKGVFKVGERNALITEFPPESKMPLALILKADGSTIYHTRDLATLRYRIDTWHPQICLYVVDSAQKLYFRQLFAIVGQLRWDLPHLEHVYFGRMRFQDSRMSTREGKVLKLQEVLDEAVRRAQALIEEHKKDIQTNDPKELAEMMGVGAVAYGVLSQNRKMDIVFDWDRFLNLEGNSAPYLQYTHARARSVIRKAEVKGDVSPPSSVRMLSDLERRLLRVLLEFSLVLERARQDHMPHILANYLFELAQAYNAFYNTEPILKAQEPQRSLRLFLTDLTASVLKVGAEILTLRVPERM